MKYSQTRRDTRVSSAALQATAFSELLRQGATLVVDNVEEVSEPIRRLGAELEHTFQERVVPLQDEVASRMDAPRARRKLGKCERCSTRTRGDQKLSSRE